MVVYNPKRHTVLYKVTHHKTKTTIYVGKTVCKSRRKAAYRAGVKWELKQNKGNNLMLGHVRECQDRGLPLNLVTLPEFPDGLPADRAEGFEALMINDLKTSSEHAEGRNTSMGENLAEHKPQFQKYRDELAASGGVYVWSEADMAMREAVAPEVVAAQAQLAALQDLQTMVRMEGDFATPILDEQVQTAIIAVYDAVRKYMGPLQLAETLAEKYEAQLGVLPVNGSEFTLRDTLNAQPESDADLLGLCKGAEFMTRRRSPHQRTRAVSAS